MYNTSEESQTEVIKETVVRTGPDGKPVLVRITSRMDLIIHRN